MNGPFFRGKSGGKHYYVGIAEAIKYVAPEKRGKQIFEQLDALGLIEEFTGGQTPFGLPYTFSTYELEVLNHEH